MVYPGQMFDNSRVMEDGFTTIPGECSDVRTEFIECCLSRRVV